MEALALGVKASQRVDRMKEVISESSGASPAFDGSTRHLKPSPASQAWTWPKASCCHWSGVRLMRRCEPSTNSRTRVGP